MEAVQVMEREVEERGREREEEEVRSPEGRAVTE